MIQDFSTNHNLIDWMNRVDFFLLCKADLYKHVVHKEIFSQQHIFIPIYRSVKATSYLNPIYKHLLNANKAPAIWYLQVTIS